MPQREKPKLNKRKAKNMRRQFKKSTPEEIEEYKKLYQDGWTYTAIAKKFGRDHTSIMWHIKKIGKERKPKERKPKEIKMPVIKKPKALTGIYFKDKEKAISFVQKKGDDYLILAKGKDKFLVAKKEQFLRYK